MPRLSKNLTLFFEVVVWVAGNVDVNTMMHRPKCVQIFKNLPNTPDFDDVEGMKAVQELELTEAQLKGDAAIPLK